MGKETVFRIGSTVRWCSQGKGSVLWKTGIVIAKMRPNQAVHKDYWKPLRIPGNRGPYRKTQTSYIVNCSGKLYWPKSAQLTLIETKGGKS